MCICLAGVVIMSSISITLMLIYTGIMRTMTLIDMIITNTTRSKRSNINGPVRDRIGQ